MSDKLSLLMEAEKRGLLNQEQAALLQEARRRGLVANLDQSTPQVPQGQAGLSWADVPGQAAQNLGASAKRFADNVTYPIRHPVETATAIKDMGVGLGSKALEAIGFEQDPKRQEAVDAVGRFIMDRYGSLDAFKQTLATDPVGALADISLVLTGGAAAAARLPGAVGTAAQTVGRVGRTLDPLMAAGRAAGKAAQGAGRFSAAALGLTTGAGTTPIQTAFRAGREGNAAFLPHMRGQRPLGEAVDMAESAVGGLRQDRSAAYNAGMQGVRTSQAYINSSPIAGVMTHAYHSVVRNGFVKDPKALKVIEDARALFDDLMQQRGGLLTIEDLDDFKQALYNGSSSLEPGSNAQRVARNMSNAVKAAIIKIDPEYARTMADYGRASDQINEMRRTLSINEKATTDTTLRKLQSSQRDNVNTNFGQRRALVDDLAQYEPDLPYVLAGQSLSGLEPRGLARVGTGLGAIYGAVNLDPAALAVLPLTSPRGVGEAAHAAGRVTGAVGRGGAAAARAAGLDRLPPATLPVAARVARVAGEGAQAAEPLRGSMQQTWTDKYSQDELRRMLAEELSRR